MKRLPLFLILLLGSAPGVFAQSLGGTTGAGGADNSVTLVNPLGADNLQTVLQRIVPTLIAIAAPIVTIMVLYGAFLMLTSGGDEEKISKGRKTITWAAIGFFFVLLATSIVPVIQNLFSGS